MLNIGCGTVFHPAWVNIDLGVDSEVISHDVANGLPFPDNMYDVVYHSHLLEHMPVEDALPFMKECFRVLKPGGVIRVLVPDLEQIARFYLEKFSTAREHEVDYDWLMLELYDQCVRQKSGGLMESYLRSAFSVGLSPFITARIGEAIAQYREQVVRKPVHIKLTWQNFARIMHKLRMEFAKLLVYVVTGKKGRDAFMEGMFRSSGEVHRWMYDRFSLGRLMANAGLTDIQVVSPFESSIPGFNFYNLDVINGSVRKPDSLVMEGIKP